MSGSRSKRSRETKKTHGISPEAAKPKRKAVTAHVNVVAPPQRYHSKSSLAINDTTQIYHGEGLYDAADMDRSPSGNNLQPRNLTAASNSAVIATAHMSKVVNAPVHPTHYLGHPYILTPPNDNLWELRRENERLLQKLKEAENRAHVLENEITTQREDSKAIARFIQEERIRVFKTLDNMGVDAAPEVERMKLEILEKTDEKLSKSLQLSLNSLATKYPGYFTHRTKTLAENIDELLCAVEVFEEDARILRVESLADRIRADQLSQILKETCPHLQPPVELISEPQISELMARR